MGKLIENYSLQTELGSGVYSRVFKAINVVTKQQVAIKMVKADKFKELPKLEEGTINQINTLTSLKPCPNIIRYYDMLKTVNNFYFVYEYCNGGTLQKILKRNNPLGQKQALQYFRQLITGFKVLAEHNIMHRDIKPENILIHNGVLKIADFGFCKPLQHQDGMAETMLGSPIYMAPEVLKGEAYTIKADIWSLGVVLYRLVFGFCPFESNNIGKLILILNQQQLKIPSNIPISPILQELIRRMLTKDAKNRADWNEVFTFEITENGEIYNPFKKQITGSLKASTVGSINSNKSPNYGREQQNIRRVRRVESPQHYDSKNFQKMNFLGEPSQLRDTFQSKSPIRGTISTRYTKKEVHIKNHKKCIELSQLSLEVANFESTEAIAVSYILNKSIEKQLFILKESIKKDYTPTALNSSHSKTDDSFIQDLSNVLSEQFKHLNVLNEIYEQILFDAKVNICEIVDRKKQYLKSFIVSLNNLDSKQELSLCHQLLDYILQDILINKTTYEKLNSEQMCKKIRDKLHQIN